MPWKTCEVTWAGPTEAGEIVIALRAIDNSFESWFKAHPTVQKEMLATALCSMSNGLAVEAGLSSFQEYSLIERLYVRKLRI